MCLDSLITTVNLYQGGLHVESYLAGCQDQRDLFGNRIAFHPLVLQAVTD